MKQQSRGPKPVVGKKSVKQMGAEFEKATKVAPVPSPRYKSKILKIMNKSEEMDNTIETIEEKYKKLVNDYVSMNAKNVKIMNKKNVKTYLMKDVSLQKYLVDEMILAEPGKKKDLPFANLFERRMNNIVRNIVLV